MDAHRRDRRCPGGLRLVESGVTFDRAIATSTWALPSHGSMRDMGLAGETRRLVRFRALLDSITIADGS